MTNRVNTTTQDSYHARAQSFIKDSKTKGYGVKAEGSELIAYPPRTPTSGNREHVIGAFHRMLDYLGGTSHVDNTTNPASAYSMVQRKIANQPKTPPKPLSKATSSGKGVGP